LFVKYLVSCKHWNAIYEVNMTIAERVKLRRAELSLTQAELAAMAETSQQAIQQLEDGKQGARDIFQSWRQL
jgi:DNA-binding XRE family transcriptional regulator